MNYVASDSRFVCIPVDSSLYNELVIRVGNPKSDVIHLIDHAIRSFLERTADDEWSPAYAAWMESQESGETFTAEFGDPLKGYHWTPLFLPNGTKLLMAYGGKTHDADVRHEKIVYLGQEVASPSLLASTIAAGTSRNAWRDLRVRRPGDLEYRLADDLRREGARK